MRDYIEPFNKIKEIYQGSSLATVIPNVLKTTYVISSIAVMSGCATYMSDGVDDNSKIFSDEFYKMQMEAEMPIDMMIDMQFMK